MSPNRVGMFLIAILTVAGTHAAVQHSFGMGVFVMVYSLATLLVAWSIRPEDGR